MVLPVGHMHLNNIAASPCWKPAAKAKEAKLKVFEPALDSPAVWLIRTSL